MEYIDSLDDPRVASYRNLRDRTLAGENLFVAEGRLVVSRLLESEFDVESVLVAQQFADDLRELVGPEVPLYMVDEPLLVEIVGYDFHRGVLAVGRRRERFTFGQLMDHVGRQASLRLVVCPEVANRDNLGLVFRAAAGFGVDGILLGPGSGDPLARRCLRLSMGAALRLPFARSGDLAADLTELKECWGVELVATVLDDEAEHVGEFAWPARVGLLFGHEHRGLDGEWLALCDHQVTLPMAPGTDSLNLAMAAGIFIYEMTRARPPASSG